MKARGRRAVKIVAGTALVLLIAALVYPVLVQGRSSHDPSCFRNQRSMASGLSVYMADYDDRLPDRDAWMEGAARSVSWKGAFHCPQAPKGAYGYAFNGALSRAKPWELNHPETTPLVYDSVNPIRNASDLVTSLPAHGRHGDDNIVCYADMHIRAVPTR